MDLIYPLLLRVTPSFTTIVNPTQYPREVSLGYLNFCMLALNKLLDGPVKLFRSGAKGEGLALIKRIEKLRKKYRKVNEQFLEKKYYGTPRSSQNVPLEEGEIPQEQLDALGIEDLEALSILGPTEELKGKAARGADAGASNQLRDRLAAEKAKKKQKKKEKKEQQQQQNERSSSATAKAKKNDKDKKKKEERSGSKKKQQRSGSKKKEEKSGSKKKLLKLKPKKKHNVGEMKKQLDFVAPAPRAPKNQ
jgi:hypothetical protein